MKKTQLNLGLDSETRLKGEAKVLKGEWVENIKIYTLYGYIFSTFFWTYLTDFSLSWEHIIKVVSAQQSIFFFTYISGLHMDYN